MWHIALLAVMLTDSLVARELRRLLTAGIHDPHALAGALDKVQDGVANRFRVVKEY